MDYLFGKYSKVMKLFAVLLIYVTSSIISKIVIAVLDIDIKTMSQTTEISILLFRQTVVAIIIFFMYFKDLKKEFAIFKKNFMSCMDEGIKYWLLGLLIMASSSLLINFFSSEKMSNNEAGVRKMLEKVPIQAIILTSILAPFIEELIFRKSFKDALKEKWLFILTSGIVFGSLHVLGSITSLYNLLYLIPYSALGISFAYIYYKTDTIFTSISMHLIHNVALSLMTIFARGMIL